MDDYCPARDPVPVIVSVCAKLVPLLPEVGFPLTTCTKYINMGVLGFVQLGY